MSDQGFRIISHRGSIRSRLRLAWRPALMLAAIACTGSIFAQTPEGLAYGDDLPATLEALRHNPRHETRLEADAILTSRVPQTSAPLALPVDEDSFTFAVYGDRTGGPNEGVAILARAVQQTNLIEPDLVMTVGDLIQGYSNVAPWMAEMEEFRAIMNTLACPWFPVAGNHDVYWRGPNRPEEEHEDRYEMHFGPLWYAFEHRDCFFIVLYSDEANPETGERNFSKPECQIMSPEQFEWLDEMLTTAQDARHVFVFVHHPRWIGGNYGDDWDRVHERLVAAENVSGVFAGHIHRMRHDPRDGINYFALATVGGHQSGMAPEAGFLDQFHLVTVRQEQIAVSSVPVGVLQDPRAITGAVSTAAQTLVRTPPEIDEPLTLTPDGSTDQAISVTLINPTEFPLDFEVRPTSTDAHWQARPDHAHARLPAGGTATVDFQIQREAGGLEEDFAPLQLAIARDLGAGGYRFAIPEQRTDLAIRWPATNRQAAAAPDRILMLDGIDDALRFESDGIALPDGPFTLECWFNPTEHRARIGLLTKTESSEFGFFLYDGRPEFCVHLNGRYVIATDRDQTVSLNQWHHLAGVFDGSVLRLYLDGQQIAEQPAEGRRTRNRLPLFVGADVTGSGDATSHFAGQIDGVRLSTGVRYEGNSFEPARNWPLDDGAVLLLNMDRSAGTWILNEAGDRHGVRLGGAELNTSRSE